MKNKPIYDEIHFSRLILDNCNPRIPKSLHNMQEEEIINFLLLEASTLELIHAIGENDFFQGEQLLVVPAENGNFKVLEGNRRLASVKLLSRPEIAKVKTISVKEIYESAKFRPQNIPCLIFEQEDDIRKYLGFRHITGIKPWGHSEKARYLFNLYQQYFKGDSIVEASKKLAKTIGSRKDYVKRVLVAYEVYRLVEDEGFYKIRELNDTNFYISYLTDSLSQTHIAKFIGLDFDLDNPISKINKENLKNLIKWFFERNSQNKTRLKGNSSDLNKLNTILNLEKSIVAYNAFADEGKDLDTAYELTEDLDTLFVINIQRALQYLESADAITHRVKVFYDGLDDELIQIRKLTSKIKQTRDDFKNGGYGKDEKF